MKKWILFLIGILSTTAVHARFEIETIRTPEAPGFFTVNILPLSGTKEIVVHNVFVTNYPRRKRKQYEDLITLVKEIGGKVVEKEEAEQFERSSLYRVVWLDRGPQGSLVFEASEDDLLGAFEAFSSKHLGPVYLTNVTATFEEDNISETYPQKIDFVGFETRGFVGKFEEPTKTKIQIRGFAYDGEVVASATMDLTQKPSEGNLFAQTIPDMWEREWRSANNNQSPDPRDIKWWIFPAILAGVGIIIVIGEGIRIVGRKKKKKKPPSSTNSNAACQWNRWSTFRLKWRKKAKTNPPRARALQP